MIRISDRKNIFPVVLFFLAFFLVWFIWFLNFGRPAIVRIENTESNDSVHYPFNSDEKPGDSLMRIENIEPKDSVHRPYNVDKEPGNSLPTPNLYSESRSGENEFPNTIIRLRKNDYAFIFTDSALVPDYVLDSLNREGYYSKAIALVPKEDIKVHLKAWEMKELRHQQIGDGGLYTVVTWTLERPNKVNDGFYTILVKRYYGDRLGTVIPIAGIKINPVTNKMFVCDGSWDFYPIDEWRKMEKMF